MEEQELYALRYPIGTFNAPTTITPQHVEKWSLGLREFPNALSLLVSPMTAEQLDMPYRPGGWTVRQLIHHIADSHHHSYIRYKWALTEDKPVIKAYDQDRWANLPDARSAPIQSALVHIGSIHAKLVLLLETLEWDDLQRTFIHPEDGKERSLAFQTGLYDWHGRHHYAHIAGLIQREGF